MSATYSVDVDNVIRETENAFYCLLETGDEVWVPKSIIDTDESDELAVGQMGTIYVKTWWARKEGLV